MFSITQQLLLVSRVTQFGQLSRAAETFQTFRVLSTGSVAGVAELGCPALLSCYGRAPSCTHPENGHPSLITDSPWPSLCLENSICIHLHHKTFLLYVGHKNVLERDRNCKPPLSDVPQEPKGLCYCRQCRWGVAARSLCAVVNPGMTQGHILNR